MRMTPIEFWRAGFVFWTRAAEVQLEFASQWICAVGQSQHAAQKAVRTASVEALRAATVLPFAPNAISAPVSKPMPMPQPVAAKTPRKPAGKTSARPGGAAH